MRSILLCLIALILTFLVSPARAQIDSDISAFARIPVLHEGRVKPLDSVARIYLTSFYGKNSFSGLSASQWFAELLFNQELAYQRTVFNIPNPDVLHAIGLAYRNNHRYSFIELSSGLSQHLETVIELQSLPQEQLTLAQKQLIQIYIQSIIYYDLSRSLTLLLPDFKIDNQLLASTYNVPLHTKLSYLDLLQKKLSLIASIKALLPKDPVSLSQDETDLLIMGQTMMEMENDQNNRLLKIIPAILPQDKEWLSPWATMQDRQGSVKTAQLLKFWTDLAHAYRNKDTHEWEHRSNIVLNASLQMAAKDIRPAALDLEYIYNKLNPFKYSLTLYLLSFLIIIASSSAWKNVLRTLSLSLLSIGALTHLGGIILRVYIMQRPPVATLYESILFVGLVVVLLSLAFEIKKRNGIALLTGACLGTVLQFIGTRYNLEGDSMGVLVAVLNTNFWLSTHVICITIGYGCCLISAVLAHLYLLIRLFHPHEASLLKDLSRMIIGTGLLALLFCLTGTILGGIWADQSWGRFWGWDPKENGAMLICLWLIMLLHGKMAGIMKDLSFACGMALLNIIVALAWFGVNLLSVGLHSYGFTENIAFHLALFCGIELILITGCASTINFNKKPESNA